MERVALWVMSDAQWPLERPMRERYLAIATDRPIDLGPLVQRSVLRSSATSLPPVLERALGMSRTRGREGSPQEWGVAFVDLLIETQ